MIWYQAFVTAILIRETGRLELASTITPVLKANLFSDRNSVMVKFYVELVMLLNCCCCWLISLLSSTFSVQGAWWLWQGSCKLVYQRLSRTLSQNTSKFSWLWERSSLFVYLFRVYSYILWTPHFPDPTFVISHRLMIDWQFME